MPNKPDPFFSKGGEEFIPEQPMAEPDPSQVDPVPEPPPVPLRMSVRDLKFFHDLLLFLRIRAAARVRGITVMNPAMCYGFDQHLAEEAVNDVFRKVGVHLDVFRHIDVFRPSLYSNVHVRQQFFLVQTISHAVVSMSLDEVVEGLVDPSLGAPSKRIAGEFFRRIAIAIIQGNLREADVIDLAGPRARGKP